MPLEDQPGAPIGGVQTVADYRREHRVRAVIEHLDALSGHDRLTMGEILGAFGRSSFLPVMMVPALLVISPLSGIPLFSSLCGLMIAIVSAQLLVGRPALWLPGWLRRRSVSGDHLHGALRRLRGLADWLDRNSRDRWRLLTERPFRRALYLACLICGLSMPFLEVVPFSASILGGAVMLFSVGMLVNDGVFVVLGLIMMGLAALVPVSVAGAVMAA